MIALLLLTLGAADNPLPITLGGDEEGADATVEVQTPTTLRIAEEDLDQHWVGQRMPAAVYPGYERRKGTEGCVRMGIIIEPNGRIGFVETLFSVPPATFERSAHSAMKRWRFKSVSQPAPEQPIYTTYTMVFFPGAEPQTLDDLAELCLPPNLEDEPLGGAD